MSDGLTSLLTSCYATSLKHVIVSHKKIPFLSAQRRHVRAVNIKLHTFVTSALDGGDRQHTPAALLPGKKCGIHGVWRWVCPRAGLDLLEKEKIFCPCRGIVQPLTYSPFSGCFFNSHNGYWFFPGGKERHGRDADPSPPSSAVVKKG